MAARSLTLTALTGIPDVRTGDDLVAIIVAAIEASGLRAEPGDALVIAQKIVSKAEGRWVKLGTVVPSERARELAALSRKDPRIVELILSESSEVMRCKPNVIIVRHRLGYVMASAGIDQSNTGELGDETVLLLPVDPEASAARIRSGLRDRLGVDLGVIINDSFGRAWRNGVVGISLGVSGVPALVDMRGQADRYGRTLHITQIGVADELAAAASLVMGQGDEGTPVVLARGVPHSGRDGSVRELIRAADEDMFR